MMLSRLKLLSSTKGLKDNSTARKINQIVIKQKTVVDDSKYDTKREIKSCQNCGSNELSYSDGVVCLVCGSVLYGNFVSSAEEVSATFNNCSNRKSDYTSFNEVGSSFKLQSCITGGKKYGGNHVSQKNYQEETRLKNIKFIKTHIQKLPFLSKAIGEQAIKSYVAFKIKGNTNRAQINKGIICAFVKRSALKEGIELTNKKLNEVFGVEIKHITKGIQIIIDDGYHINYDINMLIINYIKYNFSVLRLPSKYMNIAVFLALFVNKYMSKITTSFIPHSVSAWVTFYIILEEEIDIGIDRSEFKDKLHLYASKVKALFDTSQPTLTDHLGSKREHIVSNVNITKIDRIMMPYRGKINEIIQTCKENPKFMSIHTY